MLQKKLPILISIVITFIGLLLFIAVVSGYIGNYEVWRIAFSGIGLIIFIGFTGIVLSKIKKQAK